METGASAGGADTRPQARVTAHLMRARELGREEGDRLQAATGELETALELARATPYEIEFQTRVELALALGELYVAAGAMDEARRMLSEEAAFTEKIFQIMQATGTPAQKRAAAGGRVQVRDRARQLSLIGSAAPEITVKEWLNGAPASLASLRGQVVLLEFWATWCKPCQEMFGKLKSLDEQYGARGLEIIALTRHYFAQRGEAASEAEELELMRQTVKQHEVGYRAGVAPDESLQELYGATGLPTLALVDRTGVVRYAHFGGGEDQRFEQVLRQCLDAGEAD